MGQVVYSALLEIFYKESQVSYSGRIRAKILSLLKIQLLAENLNFLWIPLITWPNWSSYQSFWVVISYGSIDQIFASVGGLFFFCMLTISILAVNITIFLAIFVLQYNRKTIPLFVIKVLR